MNITNTASARKPEYTRANALALRKQLQEEIQSQREENAELRRNGEMSKEEFRQSEAFLNSYDLDRARAKTDFLASTAKTLAGFAAGSLAGYQGGFIGGATGSILGASVSDGVTLDKEVSPGLSIASSLASAVGMGFAGAQGGIVGALAGGISGALAVNYGEVPFLLRIAFDN